MNKLLYIQASPRFQRSKSIMVADAFVAEYLQHHSDEHVETLNVFNTPIPDFDGLAVQAKYKILHNQPHSREEATAWNDVEKVIEEFKSYDKYVLAIAMWNFSIPYRLKQYIDVLIQPGYTFSFSEELGYKGLVVGKPLIAIYARGGEYKSGTELETFDLQKRYIELIFGFIGFESVQSIIIEPTLMSGPDVAETRLQEAIEKAKEIAREF